MMYRSLSTRVPLCAILFFLGVLTIAVTTAVQANGIQSAVHIGRLWVNPENDGDAARQYLWPAGYPQAGKFGDAETGDYYRSWISPHEKGGTYLWVTDWEDPLEVSWPHAGSYMFRSMNYDYPYQYLTEGNEWNYLFPLELQEYYRYERPKLYVVTQDTTIDFLFHTSPDYAGGLAEFQYPAGSGRGPRPVPIVDNNLITEKVLLNSWRYIMGVDLVRHTYAWAYGTPHQDYAIHDKVLTNTGITGRQLDEWPYPPEAPAIMEDQTLTNMIWARSHDWRSKQAPSPHSGQDEDAMYVQPWGNPGYHVALAYDINHPDTAYPDWGDPATDEAYDNLLLGSAFSMYGPLFVSTDPGPNYDVGDLSQPAFRTVWYERGFDMQGAAPYVAIGDVEGQRELMLDGSIHLPTGVSYIDHPATAAIFGTGRGPTSVIGFGPLNGPRTLANISNHGWTLGFGESIRMVHMLAASGVDAETARMEIGAPYNARRLAEAPQAEWQTQDEIDLYLTGLDSVHKAAALAYWNFNGEFAPNVTMADLERWGISNHVTTKPAQFNVPYNVPDPPRSPGFLATYARAEADGGGIVIRWGTESETTPNHDTGVQNLLGYRIYRTAESRLAPPVMIAEGAWHGFPMQEASVHNGVAIPGGRYYIDGNVIPGRDYWYAVVAFCDGTQNWAQPGVSLESVRWFTWSGYSHVAPIALASGQSTQVVPPDTPPGGSEIEGEITTQTWQSWRSPYRVTGTVIVPEGNTLTIDAGVDVLFDADVQFIVEGAIRVRGTRSDSVRFLKSDADQWRGIRISGGDSSYFAYTRISDGNEGGEWPNEGGGLSIDGAGTRVTMANCVISGNTAGYGGGLTNNTGTVELKHSTISNNVATGGGGGLYNYDGIVALANCTITGNTAESGGGLASGGTLTLKNCAFSGNTATGGGGLDLYGNTVIINCTIFGNSATERGGGVRNGWGAATLTNSILWANTAPDGSQIYCEDGAVNVHYSNVQGGIPADVTDGGGNIDADPLFRDAAAGDFRLTEGSPCIDAGDPASPFDPDGTPADMGAFWFPQGYLLELPTLSVGEHATFTLPITAVIESARGVNLAFTFNSAAIAPATPFIVSTAFDGAELANVQHNVRGDTVLIAMAAAEEVTLGGVLAELRFVAISEGSSPLLWLPDRVDVDEELPHLVDGSVQVAMLYGDVSNDGTISAFDASMVLRYVVMLIDQINFAKADVSGNGKITAYDAALILHHVVNPSYVFPVEGGPLLKPATSPILAWERADGAWVLRSDTPSLLGAELELRLADGVQVTSPSLLELSREGGVLRVAVASAGDGTEVLRVHSQTPPLVLSATVNEQDVTIAQPVQFSLSQNAPNPFNPETTLRFGIEVDGPAKLVVYDVNGRLVRTLVDGNLTAGHHEVVWDARDNVGRAVASGVYVYRLTSGDNVAMRRMVLVR